MEFNSLILRARSLSKSYGAESVLKNFNIDLEDYVMDHCLVIEWPLNSLKKRYHQEALFIKIEVEKTKRIIDIQSQNTKWLQQIQ